MVDQKSNLDSVFGALSDPTRRAMLESLTERECSIKELAAPFAMSLAGAAKHVQVLSSAGLITRRKQGRTHYCKLNSAVLQEAHQWLEQYSRFWNARFDRLEELLKAESQQQRKQKND